MRKFAIIYYNGNGEPIKTACTNVGGEAGDRGELLFALIQNSPPGNFAAVDAICMADLVAGRTFFYRLVQGGELVWMVSGPMADKPL